MYVCVCLEGECECVFFLRTAINGGSFQNPNEMDGKTSQKIRLARQSERTREGVK